MLGPEGGHSFASSRFASSAMTARWLSVLRWHAVLGQLVSIIAATEWLGLPLNGLLLASIVVVTATSNLFARRLPPFLLLSWDVAALTLMLALSGGPKNPFVALYIAHVALASMSLPTRPALAVVALCSFGYALLHAFFGDGAVVVPSELFFRGLPVAIALSAAIVCVFIISLKVGLERAELERNRSDRLASLSVFAADAAHELGSPLATIAVAAADLQTDSDDGLLIRDEVERCRRILQRMSEKAGQLMGEVSEAVSVKATISMAVEELKPAVQQRVRILSTVDGFVHVPPLGFRSALTNLLNNAIEASDDLVQIRASARGRRVSIEVLDRGVGLSPAALARLGEPFYSTKAGAFGASEFHSGLGVFLARSFAERLGGELHYESSLGEGTRAILSLPLMPFVQPVTGKTEEIRS